MQVNNKLTSKIQIMSDLIQNDQHVMNKLQQIVPELRKEIQDSVRNRLAMQLEKAKAQKRQQMHRIYQEKINHQIEARNQELKRHLASIVERIEKTKRELNVKKPRRLTKEEEQELVEATVQQMLSDQTMLEEVKSRLRPKIQIRVRAALERELQQGIELMKKEIQERINTQREAWTEERIQFWSNQSQIELNELAQDHAELMSKKQHLQSVLNQKKALKKKAEQRWEEVTQQNAHIADLKAQLKRLQQMR